MSEQIPAPAQAVEPMESMEYLSVGRPEPVRRRPRKWAPIAAGAVTFVLVLLLAGAVAGDWATRNIEMRALITQVEVSEQAMSDTQAAWTKAVTAFKALPNPTDADRTALADQLKKAAASGNDGVKHGGELVQSVKILPWHSSITSAQKAYLAHNHAWQDYLSKASKDAAELAKSQDAVDSTFAAAEKPMRDAIPRPDLFRLAKRVDVIYAPPPAGDSAPGQQA